MHSLHVHLQVDGRTAEREHKKFNAKVVSVQFEHSKVMSHPANVPHEGETVKVQYVGDPYARKRQDYTYKILGYPIVLANKMNSKGEMEYCDYYYGDVSYSVVVAHVGEWEPEARPRGGDDQEGRAAQSTSASTSTFTPTSTSARLKEPDFVMFEPLALARARIANQAKDQSIETVVLE